MQKLLKQQRGSKLGLLLVTILCALPSSAFPEDGRCGDSIKKVAYYAHPLSLYNSAQEKRDISLIESLGFEVLNPNGPEHQEAYQAEGMLYFEKLIEGKVQLLFFRAFPDGSIPAGIAKEIETAAKLNLPVVELPNGILRRSLSVEETREYLRESGFR